MLMLFMISWYYANLWPTFGRESRSIVWRPDCSEAAHKLTSVSQLYRASQPGASWEITVRKSSKKMEGGVIIVYLNERLLATRISDKCRFTLCTGHPSICSIQHPVGLSYSFYLLSQQTFLYTRKSFTFKTICKFISKHTLKLYNDIMPIY